MLRWKRSFWSWKGCRMDTETRRLFRALFRKQLQEQGAILRQGRLVRAGSMAEVRGDASLEAVFLELEGVQDGH